MDSVLELGGVVPQPVWGAWEPVALMLLASAAGALLLAALGHRVGILSRWVGVFTFTALMAGVAGQVALLGSLEQPLRAYTLYVHPSFTSWTAVGAYVVPLFVVCAASALWQLRVRKELGRVHLLVCTGAACAVFVYASGEIMACTGRIMWGSPLVPVGFVAGGVAGACGLACLWGPRAGQGRGLVALGLGATLVVGVLTMLMAPPAGYGRGVTMWWHTPELVTLLGGLLVFAGWHRSAVQVLAGSAAVTGAFMLFWKLVYMAQVFARSTATFSDKAAMLDVLSGPSLLVVAGMAGLLLALGCLLPRLLPLDAAHFPVTSR